MHGATTGLTALPCWNIFATSAPLRALLKRHPLKCPVAFIGGRQSEEMKQVGMALTLEVTQGRTMLLDGSHLFPMEKPLATAAAVEASLRNMLAGHGM